MTGQGIPLRAFLILDNCFLSMLTDYFCARLAKDFPPHEVIDRLGNWLDEQLDILRQFSPAGLFCSRCVAQEYNPHAGKLGETHGICFQDCKPLQNRVQAALKCYDVRQEDILTLRELPNADRKLVGPQGLSNNDFSLIALALDLSRLDMPVYILSNDQDLLDFSTWMRIQRLVREQWPNAMQVMGLRSLTYLESVHRDCSISTEDMEKLTRFAMIEHYKRAELAGTQKGKNIMRTLIKINTSLIESARIKAAQRG
jgi:hypothetical protein